MAGGGHPSFCILVSNPKTEKAKQRIEAMLDTQDGFRLAQQDLDIRGPGKFFGPDQHGLAELKIGNLIKDMQLMELARQEALPLVENDTYLQAPEHRLLRQKLKEKFGSVNVGLLSV